MSKCGKNCMLLAWIGVLGVWGRVQALEAAEAGPTTVTITDKVLVKDCTPFGANLVGRNLLKRHVEVNFEGSSHRVCLNGEVFRDGFLCYTFGQKANDATQLDIHWPDATILIPSGPALGETRTFARVWFPQARASPWSVAKGVTPVVGYLVSDRPLN